MCGINGIFAYREAAKPVDGSELLATRDHMAARGPDGEGAWISADRRIGLSHRRLSIIDVSSRGAQPMATPDGRCQIVFNGEIYNYQHLRAALVQKGCRFVSDSDTEVLLQLYVREGADFVSLLRGMFAFAIWDAEKQSLLLARDAFGIKPFWYADVGGQFRFASQVKALIAGGAVATEMEPAAHAGFLLFGHVPEPFSTVKAIRSLPAGSTMWVDAHGPRVPRQFFSVAETYRTAEENCSPPDREAVRAALLDSVRHHLVSDVPVGLFLSAGIDSGALLGLACDAGQTGTTAITLVYDEFRDRPSDEGQLAASTAARYGSHHYLRRVTEREFLGDVEHIFDAMDQPTIDGINTWFVSKAAREQGLKVALSGLGGDELFGGYPSFRDIPRWMKWLSLPRRVPGLPTVFATLARTLVRTLRLNPKLAGMLTHAGTTEGAYLLRRGLFLPSELAGYMDPDYFAEGLQRLQPEPLIRAAIDPSPQTDFAKIATLETCLYMRNQLLRDADWASMAHGVEIRVPLVDTELLRTVAPATIAGRSRGKAWLAQSPTLALPNAVVNRAKTGFDTPVKDWLQTSPRLQRHRNVPQLAAPACPWGRRWAYEVSMATGLQ